MKYVSVMGALSASLLCTTVATAEEIETVDQRALNEMAVNAPLEAFNFAFEAGDELTETMFTVSQGAGANIGNGQMFTRLPRADMNEDGQWAQHFPKREGGPQAQACISCHAVPIANGAGFLSTNVAVDPTHSGDVAQFLERNTLHLFGLGAVQRVSEEISTDLHSISDTLQRDVCDTGKKGAAVLTSKGISYGTLMAEPVTTQGSCKAMFDYSAVEGVDNDLVIKMFGWKGNHATIRSFARGAAHNEMGMQGVELVGNEDGDFDGVVAELSVGDITALTTYMAGLERPVTKLELDQLGLKTLSAQEKADINAGSDLFAQVGCAACHMPVLVLNDPIFAEPSNVAGFYEPVLPSGSKAETLGLGYATAVRFDLTKDQPNNHVTLAGGQNLNLGAFDANADGGTLVRWYSDYKRHEMGDALADPIDAFGFGASVWPTRSLAGVGSTGPYLHNGHATTLHEAIMAHGGEAAGQRENYAGLDLEGRNQIIAFLENLVIVDLDPEAEEDH